MNFNKSSSDFPGFEPQDCSVIRQVYKFKSFLERNYEKLIKSKVSVFTNLTRGYVSGLWESVIVNWKFI